MAVVLLAFGLLGMAHMQLTALKNNHSAQYRTEATIIAYDIVDRMRVNRDAALAGNYNVTDNTPAGGASALAAADLNSWVNALSTALPAAFGTIAIAPATEIITVTVQWDDSRGTRKNIAAAKEQSFIMSVQL